MRSGAAEQKFLDTFRASVPAIGLFTSSKVRATALTELGLREAL